MSRNLEVITIANIALFSRDNATNREQNDILQLQSEISEMVKEVKKHTGDKKEFANSKINFLVSLHGFLNDRFSNLEQAIRELARLYWTK